MLSASSHDVTQLLKSHGVQAMKRRSTSWFPWCTRTAPGAALHAGETIAAYSSNHALITKPTSV